MRVVILGCGASGGVPLISGYWGECDPKEPRNRRRRPSILVQHGGTSILVDAGPDVRMQLLDAKCGRLDAVLYTHAHADHSHGVDDLKGINEAIGRPLDAWGSADTLRRIAQRFPYVFKPIEPGRGFHRPRLVARPTAGPFSVGDIEVVPFQQNHGPIQSTGFRFGRMAYSTDVVKLDDAAFAALAGVEVWIVSCLRHDPHPTHSHLARTLEWIERVRPRHAVLTHMNLTLDYRALARELPPGVEPAFDGMVIEDEPPYTS